MELFTTIKKEKDKELQLLIDTHSHIYHEDFDQDISATIDRAKKAGVAKVLLPNIDLKSIPRMLNLCQQYPNYCYPMMGLHPTSVSEDFRQDLDQMRQLLDKDKYIAIGEIGIDLYWDKSLLTQQISAFEDQLKWSIESDLPIVIHTRDAFDEVMQSLQRVGIDKLRGVFHSFGGNGEHLKEIMRHPQFMIGINGVLTFKNVKLVNYLSSFPLNRILVETDAPYLAPVPYRGKRNEPAYILHTVEILSQVYDVPAQEIAESTSQNALRLFGFST
ncbi:DNase [Bacteroidales bacterium]|nr:DNase [Bacteroidales bacterium]